MSSFLVDLVLLQHVQYFTGAAVFIARVKGQINDLVIGIPKVGCVILLQLLDTGRAGGRLALGRKGQTPCAGLQSQSPQLRDG